LFDISAWRSSNQRCTPLWSTCRGEFFEHVVGDGLLSARIMSVSSNGTINVHLYNKKTGENIDSMLLSSNYFVRSRKEITRPWSMFDAIAVNTDIKHFTPG